MTSILITGAEGFIGRAVSLRFPDSIHFDLRVEPFYDIKNHAAVDRFWSQNMPEVVIHLAANPRPNLAESSAMQDAEVNILGTINVLDASARYGVKQFIYSSTAQVVGAAAQLPIDESSPCNPQNPYAISKYVGEQYCHYFSRLGLNVVVLRFFNVYGPNQAKGFAIPDILDRIHNTANAQEVEVRGPPDDSRDYIFIDDVADAVSRAVERRLGNEVVNIGSGQETSTSGLYDTAASVLGKKVSFRYSERPPGRVPGRFQANISKAKSLLGWYPRTDLYHGLSEVSRVRGYIQ